MTKISDEIRTRKLVLTDKAGSDRVVLESGEDGAPILSLRDGRGSLRIALTTFDDGMTSLVFVDNEGTKRLAIGTMADGSPLIHMFDRSGSGRVDFALHEDQPVLTFMHGKERLAVGISAIDEGCDFSLHDSKGTVRAQIRLGLDGKVEFKLNDGSGKTLFQAPHLSVLK